MAECHAPTHEPFPNPDRHIPSNRIRRTGRGIRALWAGRSVSPNRAWHSGVTGWAIGFAEPGVAFGHYGWGDRGDFPPNAAPLPLRGMGAGWGMGLGGAIAQWRLILGILVLVHLQNSMKYNPDQHHRRSIRLKNHDYTSSGAYFITICTYKKQCLFGEIADGEMYLNQLGRLVDACWKRLPLHFPNVELDAFVVMPNHIHGILILSDQPPPPKPIAAFGDDLSRSPQWQSPNATPTPTDHSTPPNPAEITPPSGSIGAIILNFKSVTTRRAKQFRRSQSCSLWQRNYYDVIIPDKKALQRIRAYVNDNPQSWYEDKLHQQSF